MMAWPSLINRFSCRGVATDIYLLPSVFLYSLSLLWPPAFSNALICGHPPPSMLVYAIERSTKEFLFDIRIPTLNKTKFPSSPCTSVLTFLGGVTRFPIEQLLCSHIGHNPRVPLDRRESHHDFPQVFFILPDSFLSQQSAASVST